MKCFNQTLWYNACFLFDKMLQPNCIYFSNLSNVTVAHQCSLMVFGFRKKNYLFILNSIMCKFYIRSWLNCWKLRVAWWRSQLCSCREEPNCCCSSVNNGGCRRGEERRGRLCTLVGRRLILFCVATALEGMDLVNHIF